MVKQPAALNAGPRGEAVEVKETAQDDESYETSEVILTEMDEIAEFCAFEQHFTAKKASGAIRYDIGRDSNKDLQLVAPPINTLNSDRSPCITPALSIRTTSRINWS